MLYSFIISVYTEYILGIVYIFSIPCIYESFYRFYAKLKGSEQYEN